MRGQGNLGFVVLVAALIVVPGLWADGGMLAAVRSDIPPALDRFLDSSRRTTPTTARILVAGTTPALVFSRATARLYPRRVYSAFPADYVRGRTTPGTRWSDLLQLAHHDGAVYILLWSLPQLSSGPATAPLGSGALVRVAP